MMESATVKVKNNPEIELLLRHGWLSERSIEFRERLLSFALRRSFEAGTHIYHYGDAADGLHAVISGAVQVLVPADDGQEFVAHHIEAGFWIGDLAMLSDGMRLVGISAVKPTRTLFFPASRILQMLEETPKFYRDFYALNHANMQAALRILANLGVQGAEPRLILRLLHLDESLPSPGGWISLPQEDLASMTAVSVPTLQRVLRKLAQAGLIETGYGRVRLLNKSALLAACQS